MTHLRVVHESAISRLHTVGSEVGTGRGRQVSGKGRGDARSREKDEMFS